MSLDLASMGLKCGLEIHQQLDTNKLFCECSSEQPTGHPSKTIMRRLRASAGESGEVDVASQSEMEKGKYFLYQTYPKCTCLVELDEEPIHEINDEALRLTVSVAKLFDCAIVDEMQVMRKTVVDGSNTSGFQRTALVGIGGKLNVGGKPIHIQTVCVEEEAAKIVERTAQYDVYDLSRLGIPLIEIATGPDITTVEQVRQVAEHIGMILRSTGKVKRGIGTIRQDLNVSIAGGARIEIKGAQDLRTLGLLTENEARRQYHLLTLKDDLKARNIRKPRPNPIDLSHVFMHTESKVLKKAFEDGGTVLGMRLAGMAGLLGMELAPNYRFGTECSGYAKIEAGVSGIFHSDELPSSSESPAVYGIEYSNVQSARRQLDIKRGDAFFLVAAQPERARKAIEAVCKRIRLAFEGVPGEVRKANEDGTTSFLRPMPGAARMYPETDSMLISIPDVGDATIELISEKAHRLEQSGLSKDLAKQLSKSPELEFYEYITAKYTTLEPLFVVKTLLLTPKEIETRLKLSPEKINHEELEKVLAAVAEKSISKEAAFEALVELCKNGKLNLHLFTQLSEPALEAMLKSIIADHPKMPFNALIGKAMEQLRGKADGKKIVDTLKRLTT